MSYSFVHVTAVADETEDPYDHPIRMSIRTGQIVSVAEVPKDEEATGNAYIVTSVDPYWWFEVEETYDDIMGQLL